MKMDARGMNTHCRHAAKAALGMGRLCPGLKTTRPLSSGRLPTVVQRILPVMYGMETDATRQQ